MVFIPSNLDEFRFRRSVLFMPATNRRALEKAPNLGSDCLIFDLEDAIAGDDRDLARQNLLELVKDTDFGKRERIIRIGGEDDFDLALSCKPDAILLPKVSNAETVVHYQGKLEHAASDTVLWAMIETPLGLMNIREIACASPLLKCLVVGPNDLAKAMGLKSETVRNHLHPFLMTIIAAARSYGLAVLDGVYNQFRDLEGFAEECTQGAAMGFDGKTLIHPTQIEIANRSFGPGEDEIKRAEAIVAAFKLEENSKKGVIQLDGEMVERLHFDEAQLLLALSAAKP